MAGIEALRFFITAIDSGVPIKYHSEIVPQLLSFWKEASEGFVSLFFDKK